MKTNLYKRPAALIMVIVLLLAGLLFAIPQASAAKAAADDSDIVEQGGSYVFSSGATVTRYWVDIPMAGLESNVAVAYLSKSNGFSSSRADYTLSAVIRFDNVKYKDKPVIVLGEVDVNMPGTMSLFNVKAKFKGILHINLFPSAYNYLQLHDYTVFSVLLYANNKGLVVRDSFTVKDMKFDNAAFDSSVDDPTSENFSPEFVTDKNFKPAEETSGGLFDVVMDFFANLFGTTTKSIISIIGFLVIIAVIGCLYKFFKWVLR